IDPTLVAELYFADPKAQGGSLNNIDQTVIGNAPGYGYNGVDGAPPSPLTGDGEGDDGARGGPGSDSNVALSGSGVVAGGTGGRGGDGSDGMGHNPELIKGVAFATVDAATST